MTNSDRQSCIETLKFCEHTINKLIVEVLEEVSKSVVKKISVDDEIYKRHHNLLKHRYNLDQIANTLIHTRTSYQNGCKAQ
jgi:hypothetical protein